MVIYKNTSLAFREDVDNNRIVHIWKKNLKKKWGIKKLQVKEWLGEIH